MNTQNEKNKKHVFEVESHSQFHIVTTAIRNICHGTFSSHKTYTQTRTAVAMQRCTCANHEGTRYQDLPGNDGVTESRMMREASSSALQDQDIQNGIC